MAQIINGNATSLAQLFKTDVALLRTLSNDFPYMASFMSNLIVSGSYAPIEQVFGLASGTGQGVYNLTAALASNGGAPLLNSALANLIEQVS
jgi:hypothetical protein